MRIFLADVAVTVLILCAVLIRWRMRGWWL
jgi:hypothetical protein